MADVGAAINSRLDEIRACMFCGERMALMANASDLFREAAWLDLCPATTSTCGPCSSLITQDIPCRVYGSFTCANSVVSRLVNSHGWSAMPLPSCA